MRTPSSGGSRPRGNLFAAVAVGLIVSLTGAAAAVASRSAPASRSAASAAALVKARHTSLGTILVDAQGRTLYLFERDSRGRSACSGKCATFWPPYLTTGKPKAGTGAKASMLGTTRRKDGRLQVTYNRHPLYRFASDSKAGQTKGEGVDAFGGEWYAVSPRGAKVEKHNSSGSSTGYGGYGR